MQFKKVSNSVGGVIPFLAPVDLALNDIRNALFHLLATDPVTPAEGQFWYNTAGHRPKIRLNGSTLDLSDSLTLGGHAVAYFLDRGNHTSTQLANTISDFDTQVHLSRLDQMATPTADVAWGSKKITGLANGTASTDAINLSQLNAAIQGFSWKTSVRAASVVNGTLATAFANGQTIDGVALVTADRILLKAQTTGGENGIYTVNASGAPTRALDGATTAELENATLMVEEGTANAGTAWNQTADVVTVGTTAQTWVQFASGATYTFNPPLNLSGNTVSLTLSARLVNNGSNQLDLAIVTLAFGGLGVDASTTGGKSTARSNLNVPGIYTALVGDAAASTFNITQATHGLRSDQQMVVQVYDAASDNQVFPDVSINHTNGTVSIGFAPAVPGASAYRVNIHG